MRLLDWLFGINKDNASLVSEQAKPVEAHPISFLVRVKPIAHGMAGLRLDYAIIDRDPAVRKTINRYWRNKVHPINGECAGMIKPAQSYVDGFKPVTLEELRSMLDGYSNVCEYSATTGKPVYETNTKN